MINILTKVLSHIGWRKKILGYSALYIALVLGIGIFASLTIYQQNQSMSHIIEVSQQKVNGVTNARVAVVEMERALANVIATEERAKIRKQAVAAIRSLSLLDEQIQTLAETLKNNDEEVKEISVLIQRMRPIQLQVIKEARKNNDAGAIEKMQSITNDAQKVNELSQQLVEKSRNQLISEQDTLIQQGYVAITIMIWVVGIGLLIGIITSLLAAYLLTQPLSRVESAMTSLANGNLNIELTDEGTDEIGRTVKAMSTTICNLHEIISEIHSGSELLSKHSSQIGKTAEIVSTVSIKLHDGIEAIKGDTQIVHSVTDDVAERLRQATEGADITSAATKKSAQQMLNTVKEFQRFQSDMENTADVTRKLSIAADQVTSITDTIRDISSQTNLLALNAAIEAARAGDQGRGFAVVADEVRQLAKRTEDATAEISTLVEEISTSVSTTVDALETSVSDAKDNINKLTGLADEATISSERVQDMRTYMTEVEELMSSQTQAVEGITSSVSTLFDVSVDANQETEQLHQLSQNLDRASSNLNSVVDRFTL
ncbi:MAG: methyl-accepting chemotaxis protein [Gammaproteobacteria bacterium]|nr:methyl-accepting chemotaxis protein [Gammaproteobacteria bacterium]